MPLSQVDNSVDGFITQCQTRGIDGNASSLSLQELWRQAMVLKDALKGIPADFLFNEEALR